MESDENQTSDRLDRVLDLFEEQWNRAPAPDLFDFLSQNGISLIKPGEDDLAILVEVLQIDLERKYRAGLVTPDIVLAVEYRNQFPVLSEETVVDLCIEELRLRSRLKLAGLPPVPVPMSLSPQQKNRLDLELQRLVQESQTAMYSRGPTVIPGGFIGKYRIIRRLGEGGMGVVFEAEQDQGLRRRVALKIIQGKLVSREVLNRFNAERQVLALMDHDHIARVFDAGLTDDGIPFFVMELVDGLAITSFCDVHRLTLKERLELFVQTCEAIQHAHQKGIIHRDIKPSNILVSMKATGPHAKVIDFGVAKAVEPELKLIPESLDTGVGRLIGTLQYMSPEQAEGSLDIDVRSDVYSLGVLLYELLTGTPPISLPDRPNATIPQFLSAIQHQEPQRPSSRLSSFGDGASVVSNLRRTDRRRLQNEFQGELDWIAIKALEKDRRRRYDSATQFAEDIQRYLQGQVILARPPSFRYRLTKTLRRNWFAISAMATVMVTLIIAVTVTTRQMFVARAEATRANQELELRIAAEKRLEREKQVALDQSQLAVSTMTTVIRQLQSGLKNVPGAAAVRQKLLATALDGIEKISTQHVAQALVNRGTMQGLLELGDVVMQYGVEPETSLPRRVGQRESSLKIAADLFQQAHEIAVQLVSSSADPNLAQRDLAVTLWKLGHVEQVRGDTRMAQKHFQSMLDVIDRLEQVTSVENSIRGYRAEALRRLGDISMNLGETAAAIAWYARQLKASQQDLAGGASSVNLRNHSVALERMGRAALESGNPEQAMESFREMVGVRGQLIAATPDGIQERRDLATGLDLISDAMLQLERVTDAATACQQALELWRGLQSANDGPEARSDLASGLVATCHVLRNQVRLNDAAKLADEAIHLYQDLAADQEGPVSHRRNHSVALAVLAEIRVLQGNWDQAKRDYRASQEIRRKRVQQTPLEPEAVRDFMAGQLNLGRLEFRDREFAIATRELQEGHQALQVLIDAGQLVQECRGNQDVLKWYLDGCAVGPVAIGDWDNVLRQPPDRMTHLLAIRCELLTSQRRIDEIAQTGRQLMEIAPRDPEALNDAATAFATCMMLEAGWSGRTSFPPESGLPAMTAEQSSRSDSLAEEAIAALNKAKRAGHKGLAENLRSPAYTALKQNPKFRSLVLGGAN